MSDGSRLNRRRVLQGAAAAGMSTVGVTGLASAEQDGTKSWKDVPTQTVGEAQFVEFGLEFDVDLEPGRPACHAAPYHIDESEQSILFPSLTEEARSTIDTESALLANGGLEPIPTNVTRSDIRHLPVSTADHLAPAASVTVESSVRIPAIRFRPVGESNLTVAIGGNEIDVPPRASESIDLDPVPVKARSKSTKPSNGNRNQRNDTQPGKSSKKSGAQAEPSVQVNNHGTLTWKEISQEELEE